MSLKRRSKEETEEITRKIEKSTPNTKEAYTSIDKDTLLISTGSTLLDLAIAGGRVRGGGIPGGIMVEIFGPSGSGKTGLITEIAGAAQDKGGEVFFADPEARIDKEYSRIYGFHMTKENYTRPDTVTEVFQSIEEWKPASEKLINVFAADSIAALSTNMEMGEGDKRGQRKAKELSEGCRKTARLIAQNNKLVLFTNQERDGDYGPTTPGGKAIPYHCSLRLRVTRKGRIEKEKKLDSGKVVKKVIGIESEILVKKSTVDDEYRTAPLYIIFGVGIDDVRANLQYVKDMQKLTKYWCVDQEYVSMDKSIEYIEKNDFESELREKVIVIWEEIEAKFHTERKAKKRF
jgi:RecA/RadA recombinase